MYIRYNKLREVFGAKFFSLAIFGLVMGEYNFMKRK